MTEIGYVSLPHLGTSLGKKEHTFNLDHHMEIAKALRHLEDLCPLVLNVDLFFALTNTISTIKANLQALVLHHRIERVASRLN